LLESHVEFIAGRVATVADRCVPVSNAAVCDSEHLGFDRRAVAALIRNRTRSATKLTLSTFLRKN
jgi:hypothetical protein